MHPLLAIRCGVLDQGGPVSLGLAVRAGDPPTAGVNPAGRFVIPFDTSVQVLVDMDFGPGGGVSPYASPSSRPLQDPPLALWKGTLCQTVGGKPDLGPTSSWATKVVAATA